MEQTVNTFNDGMITDLNPLSTPNNVLTSCLNGTFITYDGNEFVLQNDMGNGRVETAYLPSGFVPIGIKEYGGIIYVVSYNPLTNRSQIGSFPSPERNISSEELNKPDWNIISTDFLNSNKELTTYKKYELFENSDIKLRPGDQFSIIISANIPSSAAEFQNFKESAISYYGENGRKVLRLDLGVLDDNNNFKLITDKLTKFEDKNGNDYWAIFSDSTVPSGDGATVDDIRKYSDQMQVFNNNTSGKLILIAQLEIIDSFTVSTIPDFYEEGENTKYKVGFNNEFTPDDGKNPEVALKGLKVELEFIPEIGATEGPIEKYIKPDTGKLLTSPVEFEVLDLNKGILNYIITPAMEFGYLNSYIRTGSIDTSMINSGKARLLGWKYYNDSVSGALTITWNHEFYPKASQVITGARFTFYNINKGETGKEGEGYVYNCKQRYSYNGTFTESIPYGDLDQGSLYVVKIEILEEGENNSEVVVKSYARFLYTSQAFNSKYFEEPDFSYLPVDVNIATGLNVDYTTSGEKIETSPYTVAEFEEPDKFEASRYKDSTISINIDKDVSLSPDMYPFEINKNNIEIGVEVSNPVSADVTDNVMGQYGAGGSTEGFEVFTNETVELNPYSPNDYTLQSKLEGTNLTIRTVAQFRGGQGKAQLSGISTVEFSKYMDVSNGYLSKTIGTYQTGGDNIPYPIYWSSCGSHDGKMFYYTGVVNTGTSDINNTMTSTSARIKYINKGKLDVDWNSGKSDDSALQTFILSNLIEKLGYAPNIIFLTNESWNRNRTTIWPDANESGWNHSYGSSNDGGYTNQGYTLAFWKGQSGNEYYGVNIYGDVKRSNNVFKLIYDTFSKVYIGRPTQLNKSAFTAVSGIYNNSYNLNVQVPINTTTTVKDSPFYLRINGQDVPFTEGALKEKLDSSIVNLLNSETSDQGTLYNQVHTVIDTPSSPKSLSIVIKSPSISDIVDDYLNPARALENGYIDINGKLNVKDSNSEYLNQKTVYYINGEGKAAPMDENFASGPGAFIRDNMSVVNNDSTGSVELQISRIPVVNVIGIGHNSHRKFDNIPILEAFKIGKYPLFPKNYNYRFTE